MGNQSFYERLEVEKIICFYIQEPTHTVAPPRPVQYKAFHEMQCEEARRRLSAAGQKKLVFKYFFGPRLVCARREFMMHANRLD